MKKVKRAKKTNGKGVQESLDFIIDIMATKDDVREITRQIIREEVPPMVEKIVGEKLTPVTDEMQSMRFDIKELTNSVNNLKGLPKEIDYALARSSAIEKHLGLKPPTPVDA